MTMIDYDAMVQPLADSRGLKVEGFTVTDGVVYRIYKEGKQVAIGSAENVVEWMNSQTTPNTLSEDPEPFDSVN